MPDEVKLEPCPACKTDSVMIFHDKESNLCWVECDDPDCSIHGPWRETDKDAVAAWNALPRKPKWTTYDGTEQTLPPRDAPVIVSRAHGRNRLVCANWFDCGEEHRFWDFYFYDGEPIELGDRWTPWPGEE